MKLTGSIPSRILACCIIVAAVVSAAAGVSWLTSDAGLGAAIELANAAVEKPSSQQSSQQVEKAPPLSEWDKRWWIEKTARLLRGGEGLSPNDDIEQLAKLPKAEIAREFMRDERFGDTVLDFNMYFMGFKVDSLKVDGIYVHSAFDFSNAVTSAKELLDDGDYLKLLDLEGDYYLAPLTMTPSEDKLAPEDAKLTPTQLREKVADEFKETLKGVLSLRTGPQPISPRQLCNEVGEVYLQQNDISQKLYRAFTDAEIFSLLRGGVPEFVYEGLDKVQKAECVKADDKIDAGVIAETLTALLAQFDRVFKEIATFEPTRYEPEGVGDFKAVDREAFPNKGKWLAFGYEQGTALANSSTNYNRKRAAYVLKRFFCDDLNPVGFETPAEHTSGAHGSQTSCYSCHYKLDPMAGFFRNNGALFSDSSNSPDIVFDDLASVDRKTYLSAWRAPQGAGRTWDVGYIRSPRWKDQNSYGESIADLSKILHTAPEVKRCLMKRLTEYVVGENQTLDGAYLDNLTQKFEEDAAVNSSIAFRNAMVRILESQTYQMRNPDPKQCYDFAPGTKPEDRPPCRVAYILQKNCAQCHSRPGDGFNTLDLTKWVTAPNRKDHVFPHFNSRNEQIAGKETLERMGSRISATDEKKRMPKNKPMSSQERQELYLWVQSELARRTSE